jgi:hypothetical protein
MRKLCATALAVLLLAAMDASAQWSVGLRGGWTSTTISRYDAGRMDEAYSPLGGFEAGVQGSYTFNSWFAVRANLSFMQRSHRMDRNLNYLDSVYTNHRNSYLMLPVVADFSFGGERLRGHLLAGGYAGYWLGEHRKGTTFWMTDYNVYFEPFDEKRDFTDEDSRFNAGVVFGAGLSYGIGEKWALGLDALYYYDLTSHHKGSAHLAAHRYLNTFSLTPSVNYNL